MGHGANSRRGEKWFNQRDLTFGRWVVRGTRTLNLEHWNLNFSLRPVSAPDFNIKYVAHLARLKLSPEEEQKLGAQLGNILGYIEKLKEVDVAGVEPTAHAFPMVNVFRADEIRSGLSTEDALRNAPKKASGLFVVPKVVE